jgi:hypothetical protein
MGHQNTPPPGQQSLLPVTLSMHTYVTVAVDPRIASPAAPTFLTAKSNTESCCASPFVPSSLTDQIGVRTVSARGTSRRIVRIEIAAAELVTGQVRPRNCAWHGDGERRASYPILTTTVLDPCMSLQRVRYMKIGSYVTTGCMQAGEILRNKSMPMAGDIAGVWRRLVVVLVALEGP